MVKKKALIFLGSDEFELIILLVEKLGELAGVIDSNETSEDYDRLLAVHCAM